MLGTQNRLFCWLDGLTPVEREQKRLQALADSGLLEAHNLAIFDEAIQTAADFLQSPICFLGIMEIDRLVLKSTVGLAKLGLMNPLATTRQIPRSESFCIYVIDSHQVLAINDTANDPFFAKSFLFQHYGIRAYLGAPLLTTTGECLGTLAVMDVVPRNFSNKDIQFMELIARWSISEFDRYRLLQTPDFPSDRNLNVLENTPPTPELVPAPPEQISTPQLKRELLTQLTEELRTPLTSVMGMASVLNCEIYGQLTSKQKEYLSIIHNSGRDLLSLVDAIVSLEALDDRSQYLKLTSVNVEMLCQQVINTLEMFAHRREQKIILSVEPGQRIWQLDKDKLRQILYHLIFRVIQSGKSGGVVRIHVSRKALILNITVWVSHPWLGEGLSQTEIESAQLMLDTIAYNSSANLLDKKELKSQDCNTYTSVIPEESRDLMPQNINNSRENLGLLLSCQLAEIHGGKISIQGSSDSGYRYVLSLNLEMKNN